MAGRNCRIVKGDVGDVLQRGYVIRRVRGDRAELVFRPDRGSGGFALWTTRARCQQDCAEGEKPVFIELQIAKGPIEALA